MKRLDQGSAGAPAGAALAFGALDELPEATVVLTPVRDTAGAVVDFSLAYANHVAAAAVDHRAAEVTGDSVLAALPQFPRVLFDQFVAVLEGGAALRTQVEYADTFAGRRAFAGRFAVSASRVGERLLVVYEDVTSRARALLAERRFGAVIEATSDWVSIADGEANLVYVNAAGRRMVGIGEDEDIAGARVGEFSPAWARERVLAEGLPGARRDGVWRGDLARLHRDGHEIPVSQVIVARTDDRGEVEFYATIARDMTREREAQEALRASEERFRIAFEQGPVGVALLDLDGQVRPGQRRLLPDRPALARGAARQHRRRDHAPRRRRRSRATRCARSSSARCRSFRYEKRYLAPDGEVDLGGGQRDGLPRRAAGARSSSSGWSSTSASAASRTRCSAACSRRSCRRSRASSSPCATCRSSSDAEVSGDWYDVIPLPDGRVGVVIGDVVGRGVEAAATMSQLRTALRAYAVEGLQPAEVVAKLHRLVGHLRVGLSTTLTYLDLDPFTLEVRYVSAGHLPVLHAPAAGSPRFLTGARSTPLGAAPAQVADPAGAASSSRPATASCSTPTVSSSAVTPSIDRRLEQLRATVETASSDLPTQLKQLTTALTGEGVRTDDIALLALRAHGAPPGSFSAAIRGEAGRAARAAPRPARRGSPAPAPRRASSTTS